MSNNARLTDMWAGVCVCHKTPVGMAGIIVTSAGSVLSEGMGEARVGDITIGFCGHPGVIVSGSGITVSEGSSQARTGDPVVGCNIGVIVTGAGSVVSV